VLTGPVLTGPVLTGPASSAPGLATAPGLAAPSLAAAELIAAEGIDVAYGRDRVLHGVSVRVERGEIVTVVGPNGSGKSTLLRCLIGALRPDRGQVRRAPGLRLGYVPQRLHIDPTLPLTARRLLDLPRRAPEAEARAALAAAGAEGLGQAQVAELSGGELQRVLLARAMLGAPDLLLLDEPTQGLDQPGAAALYRRIEAARNRLNCGVLMVSHDLHVVMSASDRVVCLNGHVCCEGTPAHVLAAPAWRELFGTGAAGALALYRHEHDHDHDHHHGRHDRHADQRHASPPSPRAAPRPAPSAGAAE
jgi:zinc transport system ATP-binding protein